MTIELSDKAVSVINKLASQVSVSPKDPQAAEALTILQEIIAATAPKE